MKQPLLPGIEEADHANGLGFLHDPKAFLDSLSRFGLIHTDDEYAEALEAIEKNVKNTVDKEK